MSLGYYAKRYRIVARASQEKYITGKKLLKVRVHARTHTYVHTQQVRIRARTNASCRNLQINVPERIFYRVARVPWRAPGSGFVFSFFLPFFLFLSCCASSAITKYSDTFIWQKFIFHYFLHRIARALANFSHARSTGWSSRACKNVSIKRIKAQTDTPAVLSCDLSHAYGGISLYAWVIF